MIVEVNSNTLDSIRALQDYPETKIRVINKDCCEYCKIVSELGLIGKQAKEIPEILEILYKAGERFGQWDVKLLRELMENEHETVLN